MLYNVTFPPKRLRMIFLIKMSSS
jgi:hypothetical protein